MYRKFKVKDIQDKDNSDPDDPRSISSLTNTGVPESTDTSLSLNIDQRASTKNGDNRFDDLILKYKIQNEYIERLHMLEDYEIIIVCDDSGSMKTTVDQTNRTRWDELCYIVKIIIDIGIKFDSNGIDIYFLNRKSYLNVKNYQSVDRMFSTPPRGYTPLVPVLKNIFKLPSTRKGQDKKTLVFIATDGQPTDENGLENVEQLKILMNEGRNIETTHVMFLLCTDDPSAVEYLSEWDKNMTNVDVTDDYQSEKNKICSFRGKDYQFSKGDYICKALLGAIDPYFDKLNQPNPLFHITNH